VDTEGSAEELNGPDGKAFLKATAELQDVKKALKKVKEDDERLASVLRKIGPALTSKQQADYAEAFYKLTKVAGDRANLNKQALEAENAYRALVKNKGLLAKIMAAQAKPGEVFGNGEMLYDGFKVLATTSASTMACEFGNAILTGAAEVDALRDKKGKVDEEIITPACGRMAIEALGAGKSPEVALQDLMGVGGAVKSAAQAVLSSHADASDVEAPKGSPARLVSALKATVTIYSAGKEISEGKYAAALARLAQGSPGVINGVVDAVSLYRVVVRGGKPLASVAKFTEALGGGITVLTGLLAVAEDLQDLDDKSEKMQLAADCISVASGSLVLLGFGPAGAVAFALSASISFAAKMVKAQELSNAEKADRKAILPGLGLPKNVLSTLLAPNTNAIGSLGIKPARGGAKAEPGLKAEQLQELMVAAPMLFHGDCKATIIPSCAFPYDSFAKATRQMNWSPATTMDYFKTMLKDPTDPLAAASLPAYWTGASGKSKQDILDYVEFDILRTSKGDTSAEGVAITRIATNFRAFVAAH
jgi:hypothetical protein